jgi:hypothetical protein
MASEPLARRGGPEDGSAVWLAWQRCWLVLALSNVLAASRPGDWAIPRAAAERVPAQVVRSPEMRAYAELRVADARLMDLERVVTSGGDAIEPVLDALLASDEAATQGVEALSDAVRGAVAGRIRGHADALAGLSRFAVETPDQAALAQAAGADRAGSRIAANRAATPTGARSDFCRADGWAVIDMDAGARGNASDADSHTFANKPFYGRSHSVPHGARDANDDNARSDRHARTGTALDGCSTTGRRLLNRAYCDGTGSGKTPGADR